ncbi:DUF732 domain-containing protein [Williamsia deligens]|uniref:DUF732 domain-containing protein n=1 Tax=Williamsia deligens TaxID=321325 RepID=A0ABW3G1N8_9NOCA|nr:DUF732 domain-containing protein [Williamsia deligens]
MNRRVVAVLAAVMISGSAVAGCGSSGPDGDTQFLGHLKDHQVPTGVTHGANPALGAAVCKDLRGGAEGANEVISVTNDGGFTEPQAEVIVYYAIADLCTDQSSKSQDHWKDGS